MCTESYDLEKNGSTYQASFIFRNIQFWCWNGLCLRSGMICTFNADFSRSAKEIWNLGFIINSFDYSCNYWQCNWFGKFRKAVWWLLQSLAAFTDIRKVGSLIAVSISGSVNLQILSGWLVKLTIFPILLSMYKSPSTQKAN